MRITSLLTVAWKHFELQWKNYEIHPSICCHKKTKRPQIDKRIKRKRKRIDKTVELPAAKKRKTSGDNNRGKCVGGKRRSSG